MCIPSVSEQRRARLARASSALGWAPARSPTGSPSRSPVGPGWTRIDPGWALDRPRIDPGSTPDGSRMDPGWTPGGAPIISHQADAPEHAGGQNRRMTQLRFPSQFSRLSSPVAWTMHVINDPWSAMIIGQLLSQRSMRFSALRIWLPGMPPNTLSARLRSLAERGVIERRAYQQRPVRCDYVLTELGHSLRPVFRAMENWGQGPLADHRDALRQRRISECLARSVRESPPGGSPLSEPPLSGSPLSGPQLSGPQLSAPQLSESPPRR